MRVVTMTGMLPAAAPPRPCDGSARTEDAASLTGADVVQELCGVESPAAEDPGTEPMAGGCGAVPPRDFPIVASQILFQVPSASIVFRKVLTKACAPESLGSPMPYPKDSGAQAFVNTFLQTIESDGTWKTIWEATIGKSLGGDAPQPPVIGSVPGSSTAGAEGAGGAEQTPAPEDTPASEDGSEPAPEQGGGGDEAPQES